MSEEIEAHKPTEQEPGKESPAPRCSAMFRVDFRWLEGSPNGGEKKWKEGFVFFDVSSAEELNDKIALHIKQSADCYHKHMSATDAQFIRQNG